MPVELYTSLAEVDTDTLKEELDDWVAVKELKLSYHNGYMS